MNEGRLAESAVSIVMNLYTGILKGIPNLFDILTESKKSSYFHEILVRDIEFNGNAVTIAADDYSTRALEVKLQEKGIVFDKVDAAAFEGYIKSNGRDIFLLREIDFQNAITAIEEVKNELFHQNHPVEVELENDLERERNQEEQQDFDEPNEEQPSEMTEPSSEDIEDAEEPPDDSKKEKHKKKKQASHPSSESAYNERKNREKRDVEQRRTDEQKKAEETRRRYDEEKRQREVKRQQEGQVFRAEQNDLHRKKEERQASEYSSERERETKRDASAESNLNKSTNFKTGEIERGKSMEETRDDSNWVSHPSDEKPSEQSPQRINEKRESKDFISHHASDVPYESPSEIKYEIRRETARDSSPVSYSPDKTDTAYHQQTQDTHSYEYSGNNGNSPERERETKRDASAESNLNKSTNFKTGEIERGKSMEETRTSSNWISHSGSELEPSITLLGNSSELPCHDGSFAGRTGSAMAGGMGSASSASYQSANKRLHSTATEYSRDISSPEQIHELFYKTNQTDSGNRSQFLGKITVSRIDAATLSNVVNRNNAKIFTPGEQTRFRLIEPQSSVMIDKTKEILNARRLYQVRDVLSPRNMRGLIHGTQRIITQTIISRETDGGRAANEIIDYTSPAARYFRDKLLSNGAITIAENFHCNMDILTSAYAVRNGISFNDAKLELAKIREYDAMLLNMGKDSVNLINHQAVMKALQDTYASGTPENLMHMIRGFNEQQFADFIKNCKISDDLREALLKIPKKDLDVLTLGDLKKKFIGKQDQALLNSLYASNITGQYAGRGNFSLLLRRYFIQILKRVGRNSDAGRALSIYLNAGRTVYGTYRSGIRLIYTVLRKFNVVDLNNVAARVIANPTGELASFTAKKIQKTTVRAVKGSAKRVLTKNQMVQAKRVVNHASSALKFLSNPLRPLTSRLVNLRFVQAINGFTKAVSAKLTAVAAKVGFVLGWIAIIILIIVLVSELIAQIPGSGSKDDNKPAANYVYVQDTEIAQEIITELTAKNLQFMTDINNAANHRGNYTSTSGVTANENVNFYEGGAYNVVFRDFYGNELDPSHVDLNNTKAIISMATKFMPYPFQKLSDNASEDEKKINEDLKQHFKDYCNFLWAATHQISIEEYHPGHSEGVDGAIDNSGLVTSLDKGKCEHDGTTIWLQSDFTQNKVKDSICDECSEVPYPGMGDTGNDLCTHGKDDNPVGGWRMTGTKRAAINCPDEHHEWCDHSDDDYDCHSCDFSHYHDGHKHYEYEWIYECGGHMGSVVYVTIGDLSRIPDFPAAKDVDYDAVGVYESSNQETETDNADSTDTTN